MAGMIYMSGAKAVIAKMRKAQSAHARGTARGLVKAGKFLFIQSQLIVPVDQGPLKASGFVRRHGVGFKTDVHVGYTASYAAVVHEDLDKVHGKHYNIKYPDREPRGENQQAKFLETPARKYKKQMLVIIATEVIKG